MYTGYILLIVNGCLGFIALVLSAAYAFVKWREKKKPHLPEKMPRYKDKHVKPSARERSESRVHPWLVEIRFKDDEDKTVKVQKYNRPSDIYYM